MTNLNNQALHSILGWMAIDYNPNLFISVQIPYETKTTDLDGFEDSIRNLTKWTEKDLLGRGWISKHYRFAGFYEHGHDGTLHAHILFGCPDRNIDEVSAAFASAGKKYQKLRNTDKAPNIDIREITDIEGIIGYCTKQLGIGRLPHIRSERIFTCETLFNRHSTRKKRLTL